MITLVHPHFSYPGHVKAKSSIKTTLKRVIFRRKKKTCKRKLLRISDIKQSDLTPPLVFFVYSTDSKGGKFFTPK